MVGRLNGSHQWEVAETLLCLRRKVMWLSLSFVLLKRFYVSFTFSFLQVTMSQDKIVTCFHEYEMKKYEVLALYVIAIVKVVAGCSIIITNPNCGKHMPNKCYRKHISVLDEVIIEGKKRELHHHQRSSEMRV